MNKKAPGTPRITTIFTDIGGVLLTNGWDRGSRRRAIDLFKLDPEETEERHHLTFDTYETGKITLDEYLDRIVFYKRRTFSKKKFQDFMFSQSTPLPGMIDLLKKIKRKYDCNIAVLSNEGRELAEYRIEKFNMHAFVDFFIVSSFVHFRKPDADIFKLTIDVAQANPDQTVYLEDRALFVQVANGLGIHGIKHDDYEGTKKKLERWGFVV